MAIDLVSLVSQFLTPQLVGSLARAVGINEAIAQRLAAAAIPTILASLATTAAAPGGAQRLVDAVSNSDPDLLSKLTGAIGGGNAGALSEGANLLGGLLGGSGLSSVVGALSQFAGAPQAATQSVVGAVTQSVVGTIGQQDPSNWSDPSSFASLLASQKSAISAALPPELSKALGATGLLAGLGASRRCRPDGEFNRLAGRQRHQRRDQLGRQSRSAAVPSSSRFPMWAIILLIVIVLAAIW